MTDRLSVVMESVSVLFDTYGLKLKVKKQKQNQNNSHGWNNLACSTTYNKHV